MHIHTWFFNSQECIFVNNQLSQHHCYAVHSSPELRLSFLHQNHICVAMCLCIHLDFLVFSMVVFIILCPKHVVFITILYYNSIFWQSFWQFLYLCSSMRNTMGILIGNALYLKVNLRNVIHVILNPYIHNTFSIYPNSLLLYSVYLYSFLHKIRVYVLGLFSSTWVVTTVNWNSFLKTTFLMVMADG